MKLYFFSSINNIWPSLRGISKSCQRKITLFFNLSFPVCPNQCLSLLNSVAGGVGDFLGDCRFNDWLGLGVSPLPDAKSLWWVWIHPHGNSFCSHHKRCILQVWIVQRDVNKDIINNVVHDHWRNKSADYECHDLSKHFLEKVYFFEMIRFFFKILDIIDLL